jgi:peroxin-16
LHDTGTARADGVLYTVYSLTSVVSTYHDSLLNKRLNKLSSLPPSPFPSVIEPSSKTADAAPSTTSHTIRPPPSDHARYTSYFCAKSPIYRRAARMLVVIGYVQLLLEMLAIRRGRNGPRRRWKMVLWLEAIKWVRSKADFHPRDAL